jgi:hypothetical protein
MKRIQRIRTKGWKIPENTIYVGRPSKWGNQFKIGLSTREKAIEAFKVDILPHLNLEPLREKDLACWCPLNVPCHADALLDAISERKSE